MPPDELHGAWFKQQEPLRRTVADQKRRQRILTHLGLEPLQVGIRHYVHIMDQKMPAALQIPACMKHRTSGLKKHLPLITHLHLHNILLPCPRLDLVGKVMHIHHRLFNPRRFQLTGDMLYQRSASDRHKGLRKRISNRFQTGAQPRSENHGFHIFQPYSFILSYLYAALCG